MRVCEIDGCCKKHFGRGFCCMHYRRWRVHGDPSIETRMSDHPDTCSVDECEKPFRCKGFCNSHYKKYQLYGNPLYSAGKTEAGETMKFIDHALSSNTEKCISWPFSIEKKGYARISIKNAPSRAHRYVLQIHTGLQGKGLEACHTCRDRACVNPKHLYWGTKSQNQIDRLKDGTHSRGEKSAVSKLTVADVVKIKKDIRSVRMIAKEYGVSPRAITSIRRKESWAWL